jgi:hypothetical protein
VLAPLQFLSVLFAHSVNEVSLATQVTLSTSLNVTAGSTVTISGFTETQTGDNSALPITSVPDGIFMDGAGDWNQDAGALVLTVGDSGLDSETGYVISFFVRNKATARNAATGLGASGVVQSAGVFHSPVPLKTLTLDSGDAMGIVGGAAPLKTVVVTFDQLSVEQGFPLASGSNKISATISTNDNLFQGSEVTISGLSTTQTLNDAALSVYVAANPIQPTTLSNAQRHGPSSVM